MQLAERLLAGRFPTLVGFFSVGYLFMFLPAALLAYALTPAKLRRWTLLAASYAFYWLVGGQLMAYLLAVTLSAYGFGLWLGRLRGRMDAALAAAARGERKALRAAWTRRLRAVAALAVLLDLGVLLVVKYSGFFLENVNALLAAAGLSLRVDIPRFLQPLGISFFTLQAMGYVLDVCRGVQAPDRNPARVALFMAFFPQIVEGPICRYRETAQPLWEAPPIRFDNLRPGFERILYGAMKKVVVADRLNTLVNALFTSPERFPGGFMALGALCYTVQLYMDFSGSMDAVCGTAQMLGIAMPENFNHPFLSRSISEFWQRWHITLGAWLRDYVFYPVSTGGPMKALTLKARRRLGNHYGPLLAGGVALLCVWMCNGLWHGAGWNYVFFGLYHFALILLGGLVEPLARRAWARLGVDPAGWACRAFQTLRTCLLVVAGELFFRAVSLSSGLYMFGRIFTDFRFAADRKLLEELRFDGHDAGIVLVTLGIVLAVSLLNERGISLRAWLNRRRLPVRWALLYALIFFIVIFGAYGRDYAAVIPLYANF